MATLLAMSGCSSDWRGRLTATWGQLEQSVGQLHQELGSLAIDGIILGCVDRI